MKKLLAVVSILAVLPFIAAAAMRLDFTLTSCRDLLCTNRTDVFLVGEGAYIDYNSSVKGISYWSQLTFPDGTKYQITFPNRITSNETGNYTVEAVVWKEGYDELTVTKVVQFVDEIPEPKIENPPVLDWEKFLLFALAAVLTIFVVWRIFRRRPKHAPRKKEETKKPGKGKSLKKH